MNKYNVYVIGIDNCFVIKADFIRVEDDAYKFILIDQIKNKEVVVGIFPMNKTAIEKVQ
jgi:hypothetical protein